jgi:hypothetical protein
MASSDPIQGEAMNSQPSYSVSRDIRAPYINELFQQLNIGLTSTFDPETNTTPTRVSFKF